MRGVRLATLLLIVALLACAARPPAALAHAVLVASFPNDGALLSAPPPGIHLWFSEPVDPAGPGIIVIGPSGRRIALGPLHHDGLEVGADFRAAAPGSYLVIWQVTSVDTHPARGRFTFSIGHPSAVPGVAGFGTDASAALALQALARWLHLVGYALGFGPFAFGALALRPLGLERRRAIEGRLDGLVTLGVLLLVLAEPLALVAQTAGLSGTLWDGDLAGDALSSGFGRVLAQRLGAALALWMLVGARRAGARGSDALILALGLALALIDGQASHAVSSGPPALGLAANALHLAAMGVWIGGLAALIRVWALPELAERRGDLLRRFGRLAFLCVAALSFTGVLMVAIHLGRPSNLGATAYGRTLLVKLAVVAAALALVAAGSHATDARRPRWWAAEGAVLLLALALAGLLVSLAPPA